jgi:hypothetical protein
MNCHVKRVATTISKWWFVASPKKAIKFFKNVIKIQKRKKEREGGEEKEGRERWWLKKQRSSVGSPFHFKYYANFNSCL